MSRAFSRRLLPMHRSLLALPVLAALGAAPLAAGELLVPLTAGTAADGTTYGTRLWVTNSGGVVRRLTWTFIAAGTDGTRAEPAGSLPVNPGTTVLTRNLIPAGKNGLLLVSGAPQLHLTPRLEATGRTGGLRAAAAGPLVGGADLAPAGTTLHLHGLSQKTGGLITDLYLVNAARSPASCTVTALRDTGTRLGSPQPITLHPLSLRVMEKALTGFGGTNLDEARFTISCDQPFYAFARVAKPGGAELNVVTPAPALGSAVDAAARLF